MALDRLQNSGITHAFTDLLADLGDLLQKEIQLAEWVRASGDPPWHVPRLILISGGCHAERERGVRDQNGELVHECHDMTSDRVHGQRFLDCDNVRPTTGRRQHELLKAIKSWSAHGRSAVPAKRRNSGKTYHSPNSTTAAVIDMAAAPALDSIARPAAT
jgi:hypothetical protein